MGQSVFAMEQAFVASSAQACAMQPVVADPYMYQAVIKAPVVEMNAGFPPPCNPPISPDTEKCYRAHQGLYNELVDVVEQREDFVKVALTNCVYGFDTEIKKPLNTFWMYKKDIVPLSELDGDVLHTIPHAQHAQEPTIILTYPWNNFSVGTRFRHMADYDIETAYAVIRADYTNNTVTSDLVPRENGMIEVAQEPRLARHLFVVIINNLVARVSQRDPLNVMPYVWGGSSFVQSYVQSDFYVRDGVWQRDGKNDPYTGYDCSGFTRRMAQIAGINFLWKTTFAIQASRRKLASGEPLEEGDIIWVSGHVMIVSNIERNEMIEAAGYGAGFGCVHRIAIDKRFAGVRGYQDLLERYHAGQAITFLNKSGETVKTYDRFELLKLVD
jgi:hypothetical protein